MWWMDLHFCSITCFVNSQKIMISNSNLLKQQTAHQISVFTHCWHDCTFSTLTSLLWSHIIRKSDIWITDGASFYSHNQIYITYFSGLPCFKTSLWGDLNCSVTEHLCAYFDTLNLGVFFRKISMEYEPKPLTIKKKSIFRQAKRNHFGELVSHL